MIYGLLLCDYWKYSSWHIYNSDSYSIYDIVLSSKNGSMVKWLTVIIFIINCHQSTT